MTDHSQYWTALRREHNEFVTSFGVECEPISKGQSVTANGHSWRIDWVRFSSHCETVIYGWVARPNDHPSTDQAMVWLPGYSYGTPPPDSSNLVPGAITFCINVHGNPPDHPYVNPAGKDDYIANGIESPENYIYRRIVLHCMMAIDVAKTIKGINPDKIAIAGMSQGGGLALIAAAQDLDVKLCLADMPFLCNIRSAVIETKTPSYKALRDAVSDDVSKLATLSLFDPINHAPFIRVPTHVTAGGRDPSARPETILPIFDQLGCSIKALRFFPNAGHEFVAEMPTIYREWMNHAFSSEL